jgi:hypothetical protein
MKETNLLKKIQMHLSKFNNVRVFRNNVGQGWVGKSTHNNGTVVIQNARPLHAGLVVGASDLIGFTSIKITESMVGKKIAVFTAIEGKTPIGKPSPDQLNFIRVVKEAGGIAGVARTPEEAEEMINSVK